MTRQEKINKIIEEYGDDYSHLVPELLRRCGSIVLKQFEDKCGPCVSYYRDRYVIIDDVVFSTDKKELVRYSPEKTDESYVIPDYVETICDGAFQWNEHLERVTISKNIHHIGSSAFACSLSLAEIVWDTPKASGGSYVFGSCPKLKMVIADDAQWLWAFNCDNDGSPFINGASLKVNDKILDELIVPENCTNITLRAFQGCTSIKHIAFKENNKYIEELLLKIIEE